MNNSISILRVAATITIVLYHCICYYGIWEKFSTTSQFQWAENFRFVANLALNLFVFISGYLYFHLWIDKQKYRNITEFVKGKAGRLITPYLFMASISLVLFPSACIREVISGIHHLWFLLMLFGIFLIVSPFTSLYVRLSLFMQLVTVFLLFTVGVLVNKFCGEFANILCWKSVIKYIPYFLWGGYSLRLCKSIKPHSLRIKTLLVISGGIMVIAVGITETLPWGSLYAYIPTLIFFVSLPDMFAKISKLPSFMQSFDSNSMGIYLIHHVIIWSLLIYIPGFQAFMNSHFFIAPVFLFIIVIFISWSISIILNKYRLTRYIIGSH